MAICQCPDCGWFLGNVRAIINRWTERIYVMGWCKRHGWRQPTRWDADDFEFEED